MKSSVVLCTYNPRSDVFGRVLHSVDAALRAAGSESECIIVDNNSDPPVISLTEVADRLRLNPAFRVVREERQGLAHARLRGLAEATGEWIVFFDDDNEPDPSYLVALSRAVRSFPQVAVWGPGVVDVEFLGNVPRWVAASCRHLFQERHATATEYACLRTPWISAYPPGTGQSVRRDIMERYASRVAAGGCTATGRSGKSLSSGEDGQVVHTAILMGCAAGVYPELIVRHLIPASRCTAGYLSRLCCGVAESLLPASVESFPELRHRAEYAPPSWRRYQSQKLLAFAREVLAKSAPLRQISAASRTGDAVGRYVAAGLPLPRWLAADKARVERL